MTDEIAALRRKLEQIETRHRKGELADDAYAAEKARLERALVDQVLTQPAPDGSPARPSKRFITSLAAVVLVHEVAEVVVILNGLRAARRTKA